MWLILLSSIALYDAVIAALFNGNFHLTLSNSHIQTCTRIRTHTSTWISSMASQAPVCLSRVVDFCALEQMKCRREKCTRIYTYKGVPNLRKVETLSCLCCCLKWTSMRCPSTFHTSFTFRFTITIPTWLCRCESMFVFFVCLCHSWNCHSLLHTHALKHTSLEWAHAPRWRSRGKRKLCI